ncbi:MAG: hypothetical protein DWQ07_01230 [Chloroflexi bacterium]|nr:MAG: hypothetical protein DWQ07_01230 [Chloroflexota bacterium]MBL1196494.1 hypothetical protein [Chloroflexota bacterium]NOH13789.1 hypothetical protein [Chloroflexota bacterium]
MSSINDNRGDQSNPLQNWRINSFLVAVGIVLVIFIARLFTLQIVLGDVAVEDAENNRTNIVSIPTQRGVILDRNGISLAQNIASFNIAITPANLPDDPAEIAKIVRDLSILTGVDESKGTLDDPLIACGDNLGISQMIAIGDSFAPFIPVLISCDVDQDLAMAIQERAVDWPGVSVEIEPIREYPTDEITASIIGYTGPISALVEEQLREIGFIPGRDKIGYAGLELSQDVLLRGVPGRRVVEVDVAGQVLRDIEPPVPPEPGLNVVSTIDLRYQQAADAIVKKEVNFWNTFFATNRITSGAAIAMDPQTGEILAMVSFPSYENNRLAQFIPAYYYEQLILDSTQPLLNNAVGAELPAGSVFKIVTAVGALNEGVVTPEQVIETPGKITVEQKFLSSELGSSRDFVDWNEAGFGSLNFYGGISNSSNVYFYKLGGGYQNEVSPGLGICRLGTYARALGYGQNLGIELPDETDGLVPDPTWKRQTQGENWSTGDTYIASVGQGFVISTPLQVLMSAAAIANDGVLVRPTLVREVVDGEGQIIPIVVDDDGNVVDVAPSDAIGNAGLTVVSPFVPDIMWDLTNPDTPMIETYENPDGIGSCKQIFDENDQPVLNHVEDWVIEAVQDGMRLAVTQGTLQDEFERLGFTIPAAGKTGTAEYCDRVAFEKGRCIFGNWPTHSWTVAYAPVENPEIAVVSFMYNGGEGASVAGPVVIQMLDAWFELKAIDAAAGVP